MSDQEVQREGTCELTILMPCLDEVETLAGCIRSARSFLAGVEGGGEIVVADNGSTDGSQQLARSEGARVVDVPTRGYGAALMAGAMAARGRYLIMADSDGSYDLARLTVFLDQLRLGADLVMGNRFAGGIAPGAMPWLNRYLGNPILSFVGRLFFRTPVRDFHCGIRGFSKAAFERMDLQTTGMEFASEMVIKASLTGMSIAEVPTTLAPDGRSRPPHLRRWRDGWRHLRFMLLYSPRWLFLYPGLALILLGIAGVLWLLPRTRAVGGVSLDVHTLLFASAAVVAGAQSVLFSALTKVYAVREGLLPVDRHTSRLLRVFRLEMGVVVGLVLIACSAGFAATAVLRWRGASFGELDPTRVLRLVIPAVTAGLLGLQLTLGSFFLSVLQLRTRRTVSERS
jgi:glycosyltransferase involved in cell wall biosynthesis